MKFGLGSSLEKNGVPRIDRIAPAAAIPGGEMVIYGSSFASRTGARPVVHFGEADASLMLATDNRLIARVPDSANGGTVSVANTNGESQPHPVAIGMQIADNLHPVGNPAVDASGNIYVTFSGPRGQRVPVSLYKITANYNIKPFVTSLINPSGLALDRAGNLFVSCRNDGTIHRVTPDGRTEQWIEGMGIATGIAFDREENLYVGDRSGTIFKISPSREIFVFATLEPSLAAYHLAFHPSGDLYVTGPTTSSYDRVYRITTRRRRVGFLPWARPAARAGVRSRCESLRGGFLRRAARDRKGHAGWPSGSDSQWLGTGRPGAAAFGAGDSDYERGALYIGLGSTRLAAVWIIETQ